MFSLAEEEVVIGPFPRDDVAKSPTSMVLKVVVRRRRRDGAFVEVVNPRDN